MRARGPRLSHKKLRMQTTRVASTKITPITLVTRASLASRPRSRPAAIKLLSPMMAADRPWPFCSWARVKTIISSETTISTTPKMISYKLIE